jgi:NhaA family Na+:H+ antiporter
VPIVSTPGQPDAAESPLHRLEHALHPLSAWFVVPVFGFANAGIALGGTGLAALAEPLPLGIIAGLLLGKQAGILAAVWLAVRTGFAQRPRGATWLQVYGLAVLCGIGFTMSLFIAMLAFPTSPELVEQAKLGVLAGSILSGLIGYAVLRSAAPAPGSDEFEARIAAEIEADGDVKGV